MINYNYYKLKWGKYENWYLIDVPNNYLLWIITNKPGIFRGKLLEYIKKRLKCK